jgi:hypothetical protein
MKVQVINENRERTSGIEWGNYMECVVEREGIIRRQPILYTMIWKNIVKGINDSPIDITD